MENIKTAMRSAFEEALVSPGAAPSRDSRIGKHITRRASDKRTGVVYHKSLWYVTRNQP